MPALRRSSKDAFQRPGSDNALSPPVDDSARCTPSCSATSTSASSLAFVAAVVVWWLLERSTFGFELRAVGANPDASRTAGMSVAKVYTLAMLVAGAAGRPGRHHERARQAATR